VVQFLGDTVPNSNGKYSPAVVVDSTTTKNGFYSSREPRNNKK
jgi:hypothetical protein